ncbi:MAG: SagB/ThcOx family dehydrogenase [Candidatus Delongbacteria bacterium]
MSRIDRDLGRWFLTDRVRLEQDFSHTAQQLGKSAPPIEKPCPPEAPRTALPKPGEWNGIGAVPVEKALAGRESRREFTDEPLSLDELAFLLWSAQGVRQQMGTRAVLRTAPSAGARHAFETYVLVLRVAGLAPGLYRYLSLSHELAFLRAVPEAAQAISDATLGQDFIGEAGAVLVWTTLPERMEWRYGEAAYKVIALDAGHLCQNLYLACECVGAGTCAIAAYHQEKLDELLGVDGQDEFALYLAPVGKVER